MTYFFSLKMKLNPRHTTPKAMPAVARMEKMTVREGSTDTSFSVGTPSYGTTPPGKVEKVGKLEEVRGRGRVHTQSYISMLIKIYTKNRYC